MISIERVECIYVSYYNLINADAIEDVYVKRKYLIHSFNHFILVSGAMFELCSVKTA